MGETSRMHFVPKTYLKYFSREEVKPKGNEYFISSLLKDDITNNQIKEINTTNMCLQKDLYKLKGETEAERQFLENIYRELYEDPYDNIYKILTDETRSTITPLERRAIIGFVVSTFYRNNSWVNGMNDYFNKTYERLYYMTKENGHDHFMEGDTPVSIKDKTLDEFLKENSRDNIPMMSTIAAQAMFKLINLRVINDVITIVKVKSYHEFITSDNPVTFRSAKQSRPIPLDPTNTLSIAIDSKHLLQLRPWGYELDPKQIWRMIEDEFIADVFTSQHNQFQLHQTGMFLLGTASGIDKFQQRPLGIATKLKSI